MVNRENGDAYPGYGDLRPNLTALVSEVLFTEELLELLSAQLMSIYFRGLNYLLKSRMNYWHYIWLYIGSGSDCERSALSSNMKKA